MALLLIGCEIPVESDDGVYSGRNFVQEQDRYERDQKAELIISQAEKYRRHYQNGLHFEDFSKEQKELNKVFEKYLKDKIQQLMDEDEENMKGSPHILKTDAVFVNEEVKRYKEGKATAEEVVSKARNIMSMRMEWYPFIKESDEPIEYSFSIEDFIEKKIQPMLENDYIYAGVEHVEFWFWSYYDGILKKYPFEELYDKDIPKLLRKENDFVHQNGNFLVTPFARKTSEGGFFLVTVKTSLKDRDYTLKKLKEKYNLEFEQYNDSWYMPKGRPDLLFEVECDVHDKYDKEYWDYFLGLMYQDMMMKKLRTLVDEEGLTDDILFSITTDTISPINTFQRKDPNSYDMSQFDKDTFDVSHFLKKGYMNSARINLIHLKRKDEKIDYESLQKLIFRIHDETTLGMEDYIGSDGSSLTSDLKAINIFFYDVEDYERKVLVDLFQNAPLTERTGLSSDSESFSVYAERGNFPGVHYLDIFAIEGYTLDSYGQRTHNLGIGSDPRKFIRENGLIFYPEEEIEETE
ncbi:MAG: hypothetical protein Q4D65_09410 [Peptostreptococcaceae bacterium]|nr:hypothetical protein [Peptostreptococcaceae bacterium]